MNKLDQKIQEINTEILALNAKKCKLLAIKFDAKGGVGSGRYPAGSSGGREVFLLNGVGRDKIDTSKSSDSNTQKELASEGVKIDASVFKEGDATFSGTAMTTNASVKLLQNSTGMHPADLRDVVLAGLSAKEFGTPELTIEINKFVEEKNTEVIMRLKNDRVDASVSMDIFDNGSKEFRSDVSLNKNKEVEKLAKTRIQSNISALADALGARLGVQR